MSNNNVSDLLPFAFSHEKLRFDFLHGALLMALTGFFHSLLNSPKDSIKLLNVFLSFILGINLCNFNEMIELKLNLVKE